MMMKIGLTYLLPTYPQAGELVAEYVGEVINMRELDIRKKARRRDRHLFFLWLNNNEVLYCNDTLGRERSVSGRTSSSPQHHHHH